MPQHASTVPRSAWQYGFSCEFLKVSDIIDLNVPTLMKEYDFGLFLKMYEADFDDTFAELLRRLQDLEIYDNFFPWPCLSIEDGYYANEFTFDKFEALINAILAWYATNNFPPPPYILVDLEPKMTDVKAFKDTDDLRAQSRLVLMHPAGTGSAEPSTVEESGMTEKSKSGNKKSIDWASEIGKYIDQIDENIDDARFKESSEKFQHLVDVMNEHGTKALCVALPQAIDDLKDGQPFIQQFFTTPIHTVNWDLVNYMLFDTSLVESTKGFIDHDDFVHIAYRYCQEFRKIHGDKASITFGITGFGTQVMEVDPQHYLADFNAALAAGVTKIGIFCLENVLMLGEEKYREFFATLNTADGSFTPDPEKLEFAMMVQRLMEAIDFVSPVLVYLVKSGRAMRLLQILGNTL